MSRLDAFPSSRPDRRAIRILARSLARELAADGVGTACLISLAAELIDEATERLRGARSDVPLDLGPAGRPPELQR
jgi:hypothetical protein